MCLFVFLSFNCLWKFSTWKEVGEGPCQSPISLYLLKLVVFGNKPWRPTWQAMTFLHGNISVCHGSGVPCAATPHPNRAEGLSVLFTASVLYFSLHKIESSFEVLLHKICKRNFYEGQGDSLGGVVISSWLRLLPVVSGWFLALLCSSQA